MVLEFLLRHYESGGGAGEAPQALRWPRGPLRRWPAAACTTSWPGASPVTRVDAGWVVPHFEKMLYDNALLARVYAHLWRRTGSALARRVARETVPWMLAELRHRRKAAWPPRWTRTATARKASSIPGRPAELTGALGRRRRRVRRGGVRRDRAGTFEHGRSVLQRRADPSDTERLARVRGALLARRGQRVRPGRDDKVVAAWNGLAIAALAETGLLLGEPAFVAAARDAAGLLARVHLAGGRLARTSRDGVAGSSAGVLEDYACVAEGFLALSGVTGEARWVTLAGQLLDTALDRFARRGGGFFDTADDGEALVYRPATRPTGPPRPGRSPWPARCSATPR